MRGFHMCYVCGVATGEIYALASSQPNPKGVDLGRDASWKQKKVAGQTVFAFDKVTFSLPPAVEWSGIHESMWVTAIVQRPFLCVTPRIKGYFYTAIVQSSLVRVTPNVNGYFSMHPGDWVCG